MEKKLRLKRKKRNKIFWLITFILIFLILFFIGDWLRSFFFQNTQSLQYSFFQNGKELFQFLGGIFSDKQLLEENRRLKQENQTLLSQLVELENLRQENKELRQALALNLQKSFLLTEAKIIAQATEKHFFFINQGKREGITKDLVVIDSNGTLIGKVKEVYQKDALIELITAPGGKIGALIGEKKIPVLLEGEGGNLLIAKNVPKETPIQIGDIVITGNLQKEIPPSLLIGKVTEIEKTDISPFLGLKVQPFFDLSRTDLVFIVLDF